MSLTGTAAQVSTLDIQNLQAGILGVVTPDAASVAAAINAGTTTTAAYAQSLLTSQGALQTSEAVMLTVSTMENPPGGTPTAGKLLSPTSTANEFQHLIVDYLPGQLKFAVDNGIPTIVYACATIGLGIGAGGDGTQNNFLKTYGSAAMPLQTFFTA